MKQVNLRESDFFKNLDSHGETYWSGIDCSFYFNELLVDGVVQLSRHMVEQVRPYYGYADYVPHKFHHGTRLIQGEFSINFQVSEYMYSVMSFLRGTMEEETVESYPPGLENPVPSVLNTESGRLQFSLDQIPNADPKVIAAFRDNYKKGNIIDEAYIKYLPVNISRNMGIFEIENGFNLSVVFGADLQGSKILRLNPNNEAKSASFPVTNRGDIRLATGFQLQNVSIYSSNMTVTDDGRGVIETFNFMAGNMRTISLDEIKGQPKPVMKSSTNSYPQIKR